MSLLKNIGVCVRDVWEEKRVKNCTKRERERGEIQMRTRRNFIDMYVNYSSTRTRRDIVKTTVAHEKTWQRFAANSAGIESERR